MEENLRLQKDYTLTYETFKEAYTVHQKKKVYPKSYLFMAMYLIITVIFVIKAINDGGMLSYVVIFMALGFAAIEWYTPRKIRANLLETVKALGDTRYQLEIGGEYVGFSTLPGAGVEKSKKEIILDSAEEPSSEELSDAMNAQEASDNDEYEENEAEELPEKTVIPINQELSVIEYENFFLFYVQKKVFYIVPKEGFTDYELETVREISLRGNQSE